MKMKRQLGALLAAALLLSGCAAGQAEQKEQTQPIAAAPAEPEKVQAPDFTVYDIDGNEVKLSDFLGKPVVLNFWASWCGPCKMEMPDFNETYLELGDEVQFLIVNLTDGSYETVEIASEYIRQQGYSFPVFYDTASSGANAFVIRSIPTTYFIDAQGYAVAQSTGAMDADALKQGIRLIYQAP